MAIKKYHHQLMLPVLLYEKKVFVNAMLSNSDNRHHLYKSRSTPNLKQCYLSLE